MPAWLFTFHIQIVFFCLSSEEGSGEGLCKKGYSRDGRREGLKHTTHMSFMTFCPLSLPQTKSAILPAPSSEGASEIRNILRYLLFLRSLVRFLLIGS